MGCANCRRCSTDSIATRAMADPRLIQPGWSRAARRPFRMPGVALHDVGQHGVGALLVEAGAGSYNSRLIGTKVASMAWVELPARSTVSISTIFS